MKRFIVTGATGFLGSHLVRELVRAGHTVATIVRPNSCLDKLRDLSKVQIFDTTQIGSSFAAAEHVDAVIHTATCYGRNGEPASTMLEANVAFPLGLLEKAAANRVSMFVNTDTYFTKTNANTGFLTAYSLSKRHFVEWGAELARREGMHFINMRLEHLYGDGDSPSKFVPFLIHQCATGASEIQLTPGGQRRDFIHVSDAVAAFRKILEDRNDLEPAFKEFEVGTGNTITVREVAVLINRLCGNRSKLMFGALPYRQGEIMESRARAGSLKQLGWSPAVLLEEGLLGLVEQEQAMKPETR